MTIQPTAQQLDIFADSRDVVLRNGVLDQLQRRDGVAARAALEELAAGPGIRTTARCPR